MDIKDDRSIEQKAATKFLVKARDKFMSGWGGASRGNSYPVWACDSLNKCERVLNWVQNRNEMRNVNFFDTRFFNPRGKAGDKMHIYWIDDNHPALK